MRGARVAMGASLGAMVLGFVALVQAQEVTVTDHDRVWENFRREAAVVDSGQFRMEVQGITLHAERNSRGPQVILRGTPAGDVDRNEVRNDIFEVSGGLLNLIGSYGLFPNMEVGAEVQGVIQSLRFVNPNTGAESGGTVENHSTFGDMWVYGKYRLMVMDNLGVGGGVEVRIPTGNEGDRTGTGQVGTNPFVGARYQQDRFGVGATAGYQFNTGALVDQFNWSAEGLIRASSSWALRAEFTGWNYSYGGEKINDVYCSPGIDWHFSQNVIVRPQGQVGITKPALGWGLGVGVAYTF